MKGKWSTCLYLYLLIVIGYNDSYVYLKINFFIISRYRGRNRQILSQQLSMAKVAVSSNVGKQQLLVATSVEGAGGFLIWP